MSEKDAAPGPTIVIGGSDRRTADRVAYEVAAQVFHGENAVAASTENLSASGVFLKVPHLLPVGSRVRVSFTLPAGPFETAATVMRIRPTGDRGPGIGLMFHDLNDVNRLRLEELCPPARPIMRHQPG